MVTGKRGRLQWLPEAADFLVTCVYIAVAAGVIAWALARVTGLGGGS